MFQTDGQAWTVWTGLTEGARQAVVNEFTREQQHAHASASRVAFTVPASAEPSNYRGVPSSSDFAFQPPAPPLRSEVEPHGQYPLQVLPVKQPEARMSLRDQHHAQQALSFQSQPGSPFAVLPTQNIPPHFDTSLPHTHQSPLRLPPPQQINLQESHPQFSLPSTLKQAFLPPQLEPPHRQAFQHPQQYFEPPAQQFPPSQSTSQLPHNPAPEGSFPGLSVKPYAADHSISFDEELFPGQPEVRDMSNDQQKVRVPASISRNRGPDSSAEQRGGISISLQR